MVLQEAIQKYLEWCKFEGISEATIADKKRHIFWFKCSKKLEDITIEDINNCPIDKTPTRIWRYKIDLRAFFKWANIHGYSNMSYELIRNREPIMGRRPAVTEEEFVKMDLCVHELSTTPRDHRRKYLKWHAILHFMWETGLRRSEVCSLRLADLNNPERSFQVMGAKTHKVRQGFYLTDLLPYLVEFKPKDTVFSISKRELSHIIISLRKYANLDRPIVAHSFRHGYVTRLLENGCSIQDVAILAGHCKLDTTLRYFHEVNLKNKYMEHIKSPRVFELNSKIGIRNKINIKFQITKTDNMKL